MKNLPSILAVALALPLAVTAAPGSMVDAPTSESVQAKRQELRKAEVQPHQIPGVKPDSGDRMRLTTPSLLNRTRVLGDGRQWTLLPPRAIVNFPTALADKLTDSQQGKLVPWPEFYAANRHQIEAFEVSPGHLNGSLEIPERTREAWAGSPRMVVLVHKGHPITLPVRKPAEQAVSATLPESPSP